MASGSIRLRINTSITKEVIEASRECLVIGNVY